MSDYKYFGLMTNLGQAMLTEAIKSGAPVDLTEIAVGDADYTPNQSQTALMSERARVLISSIVYDSVNPAWLRITGVLPPDLGGFCIHEAGVYAANGNLFMICKLDGSYKPVYAEGMIREVALDVILEVANGDNVNLVVDPYAVIATRKWVEDLLGAAEANLRDLMTAHIGNKNNPHGVTLAQLGAAPAGDLTSHLNNKNNPHVVTAAQAGAYTKAETDSKIGQVSTDLAGHLANKSNPHTVTAAQTGAAPTSRKINLSGGLLAGGGDLSADRTITLDIASAAETAALTINNKAVTPAGLATLANGKAAASHTHTTAQVTGLDTALAAKAASARKINTSAPLAGGGDLSADRTLSLALASAVETAAMSLSTKVVTPAGLTTLANGKAAASHTHTTAQVTGLDTALAAKTPAARKINTSAPLSGGGDLSADRTLSLALATAAETAAMSISNKVVTPAGLATLANSKAAASHTHTAANQGFTQSLALNGWTKLPNGLIVQWGRSTIPAASNLTIKFPISFPSICQSVVATSQGKSGMCCNELTTSSFLAYIWETTKGGGASFTINWMAIGY